MTAPLDRYAVIGNPIAHSRSPFIHRQFAEQTAQSLVYERLLAPVDGFVAGVDDFRASGGRGLNVTVPFKLDAFRYATRHTQRARAAGAVNTLVFDGDDVLGDNTDGAGLVADIQGRLGLALSGRRVLLLGAGGAARGVVLPLLEGGAASVTILNRHMGRGVELAASFDDSRVSATPSVDALFDVVINATSAGLHDAAPALPAGCMGPASLAYEMVYGALPTAFMSLATASECRVVSDGLGMLVEQAAESFALWRGVKPDTAPVFASLRAALSPKH